MPVAYLCDFDGTISPHDIGAAFVERFSPDGEAARLGWLSQWRSGALGHRELSTRQCEGIAVSEDDAVRFAREFKLDPQFAPFVREALGRGDAVMVVSEGWDFYVRDHLRRVGLPDLPWAANRLAFGGGRVVPEFPFADPSCERCGNCKAQHVRRYRALGQHAVLVGDGLSDRCGVLAADSVLARGELAAWCDAERRPYQAFEHFGDVAEFARRMHADALPGQGRAGRA